MARVLVVDDDRDQAEIRKLLLERAGHQVWTAPDPGRALHLFSECEPHTVVMDLRMPRTEDGLSLIRDLRAQKRTFRLVVLTGWPSDLSHCPEAGMVDEFLRKPIRSEKLLSSIARLAAWLLCFQLMGSSVARAYESFPFRVDEAAEVVAEVEMSSAASDWAKPGREAAVADILLDERHSQHVMLFAGAQPHRYSVFLGEVEAGAHTVRVERNTQHSAHASGLRVLGARMRAVRRGEPDYAVVANAPVLYARRNTIDRFSDVPLLVYCERLQERGQPLLEYTAIFSNEDGGTSTRALMARWGRTADIEYVYRALLDADGLLQRATIQARGHKEANFDGRRDGSHPLLMPVTDNNMLSSEVDSPIRYQIAPIQVELSSSSREQVMDENPFTYRVMAEELAREAKLRPFGAQAGQNISDPRNYLYIEAKIANRNSRLAARVRLRGENRWRSAELGRVDYAIERDGWVRTTVELPPGTQPGRIGEIGFECFVEPPSKDKPAADAGTCRLEAVSKVFFLDAEYRPGASFWSLPPGQGWTIPTGEMQTFPVARGN